MWHERTGIKTYALLTLTAVTCLWVLHGMGLFSPNHFPSTGGADGIKNLFTFDWYLAHNQSWTNFEGMAFPFGEHISFTDGHPLLSLLLRAILRPLGFANHGAQILWMLILASWLLTPILLHRIYMKFDVQPWIAFGAAIGFTLLSPQILRSGGHYALSYTAALPLTWLLCLATEKSRTERSFILWMTLSNIFWIGTHAYLGVICIAFSFLFFIFQGMWQGFSKRILLKAVVPAVLPILGFLMFIEFTDVHGYRIESPFGYFDFTSSLAGLVAPQFGPFQALARPDWMTATWEGWSYIGLSTSVTVIAATLLRLVQPGGFKSVATSSPFKSNLGLTSSLAASALLFLIACGLPFSLFPALLDWFPFVKQFRGIGRFAWPSYYVLTCAAVVALSRFHKLQRGHRIAAAPVLVFFAVLGVEVFLYHTALGEMKTREPNPLSVLSEEMAAAVDAVTEQEADVILPLPYFHKGSEVFGRNDLGHQELLSCALGKHTGLPMLSAHLTRASILESRALMSVLALDEATNHLLAEETQVVMLNDGSPMQSDEAHWWLLGSEVYRCEDFALRMLDGRAFNTEWSDSIPYRSEGINIHLSSLVTTTQQDATDGLPCEGAHVIHRLVPDSGWIGAPLEAQLTFVLPHDLENEEATQHLNAQFIVQTRTEGAVQWLALATPKSGTPSAGTANEMIATLPFSIDALPEFLEFFVMGEQNCLGPIRVKDLRVRELNEAFADFHAPNQF